jgi:lipopolysaccharide/colanic/teichoic acid biosynthesis glycosyltransferase
MNQRKLSVAVLVADLVWLALAMGAALVLRYGIRWKPLDRDAVWHLLPFLYAAWIIWTVFSTSLPLDGFKGGWRVSAVVSQLLLAAGGVMMILLSGGYLARRYVSRLALIEFCMLLLPGFLSIRTIAYWLLRARSKNGSASRVVVVGDGRLARELVRRIQRHPEMLCRVVGILAPDDGSSDSISSVVAPGPSVRMGSLGVVDVLSAQHADEVILVLEECASPDLLNLTALCRERGIKVSVVPQFYELYLSRSRLTDLGGLPVLQLARPGLSVPALVGKRMLDLLLGSLLAVASIPFLVPLVLVLRWIKGQAFRWETRYGLHEKRFAMLRLNIDRVAYDGSRFEEVLRQFSITELPQLWNVLRGDMSLVGPRPEPLERVCRYSEWQQQRLTVKPGMTGLAQVQGLREQNSSEDKTHFDLQYLLSCSLWTDLSILLQTIWTLATRFFGLSSITPGRSPEVVNDASESSVEQEILESAHRP